MSMVRWETRFGMGIVASVGFQARLWEGLLDVSGCFRETADTCCNQVNEKVQDKLWEQVSVGRVLKELRFSKESCRESFNKRFREGSG